MRLYNKRKRTIHDVDDEDLQLPALPPTRPEDIWDTVVTVRALGDRDPTLFSDNSQDLYHRTMKAVDVQLQKAYLKTIEHSVI